MERLGLVVAMALAAAVTGALLLLMHALTLTGERVLDDSATPRIADVTMPDTRIATASGPGRPGQVEDAGEPPPGPPAPELEGMDFGGRFLENAGAAPGQEVRISSGIGAADAEYLPIVRAAPVYPADAQASGITGYCVVEYTVTATGATRDPVPVDCSPPGVWEESSVRAVLGFKYRPRVINGEAVEVAGVRNRFQFELDQ